MTGAEHEKSKLFKSKRWMDLFSRNTPFFFVLIGTDLMSLYRVHEGVFHV